jgi:hypothetical protein
MPSEQDHPQEMLARQDVHEIIRDDRTRYLRRGTGALIASGVFGCLSVVSVTKGIESIDLTCGALPITAILYHAALSEFRKCHYLYLLEEQFNVSKKIPFAAVAVPLLEKNAYPESREIARRLSIIKTNHHTLFFRTKEICLLPEKERRKQWKTVYPILERLLPLTTVIFDKTNDAAITFGKITSPLERTDILRQRASEALMTIMAKGRVVFSKITLFDLTDAMKTFGLKIASLPPQPPSQRA